MKNFKTLLLLGVLFFGLNFNCKKENAKTEDFKATFFTDLVSIGPDESCPAPHGFLNVQQGEGSANLVGDFTTRITFCVDIETFTYVDGAGSFVAANGDELFFTIEGEIVVSDEPGYDLEFFDPFTFTGGTGQFEGASGDGMTVSYVNQTTNRTDHVWTGTLTIPN